MPPLNIESHRPGSGWVQVGEVKPGGRSHSQRINKPNGQREVYTFECAPDDLGSTVSRSRFGQDLTADPYVKPEGFRVAVVREIVKNLKPGEIFEMEVQTDQSPEPKRIRVTHK